MERGGRLFVMGDDQFFLTPLCTPQKILPATHFSLLEKTALLFYRKKSVPLSPQKKHCPTFSD